MGRLVFFLEQDADHGLVQPLQLDTKSWNTIERIAGYLASAQRLAPLNTPGRTFELSVAFEHKGRDRFPVVTIQEANVPISNDADVDLADLLVEGHAALGAGDIVGIKKALARILDVIRPGWRDQPEYIERIKTAGAEVALTKTIATAEQRLA
jgi:hypothetical protein